MTECKLITSVEGISSQEELVPKIQVKEIEKRLLKEAIFSGLISILLS